MLGLYLHIPFCSAICNYCNFNRGLLDEPLKARYVSALGEEIRRAGGPAEDPRRGALLRDVDTVYFGGGTPSLLEPAEMASLLEACCETFAVAPGAEITLEANPETVSAGRLTGFRAAGVNRLSLGVQSFRDEELARLGRLHDAARARRAYDEARRAGFDNVSLDLMLGLPGQSRGECLESVEALTALGPEHASVYLLEIYPNAPLRAVMEQTGQEGVSDDEAAEMYLGAMARLDEAGLAQYEISNVARAGRRSRHNLKYWTDGAWLGFGCGAHSTSGGLRWKNVAGIDDYLHRVSEDRPVVAEQHVLGPMDRAQEALFMGLRLCEGVDVEAIGRCYGLDVWARYGEAVTPALEAGLLRREGPRLRLTRSGMLVSHEIMAVFV